MRARQPDMQRYDAGFRPERQQGEDEHARTCARRQRRRAGAQVGKRRRIDGRRHQQEHRQQQHVTRVGHRDVPVTRLPRLHVIALGHHEEVRRQRHELPGEEEAEHIRGAGDQAHAGQEAVEHHAEQAKRIAAFVRRGVGHTVKGRWQAHSGHERQEHRPETIQVNGKPARGREDLWKGGVDRLTRYEHGERGSQAARGAEYAGHSGDQTNEPVRPHESPGRRAGAKGNDHEPQRGGSQ